MNNYSRITGLAFGLMALSSVVFAQLDGEYTPNFESVEIPVFNGVTLEDTISATSFSVTMVQGLTSSKLTGEGTISATDFYVSDSLVVNFEVSGKFSASATKSGSVVRLSGAKTTLGSDVSGDGTYTENEENFPVTVTKVVGAFGFKTLNVNLDSEEISGVISPGKISVSGYLTDTPSEKGTISGRYGQEDFGPFDFPAENIISPAISLNLSTSSKNMVTGSATGDFGDYDEVSFTAKGKRNAKTGISTVTLTGTGAGKGVSASLNLDADGEISGTKNALNVLGYKLKF